MLSETHRTIESFTRWLDEVVARGAWQAETSFVSTTYTVHSHAGTRHFTRDEWMAHLLRTRPPDWRLVVHDLVAHRDRVGALFTRTMSDPQTGAKIVKHAIGVTRFVEGQFAETWIAPRPSEHGPWPNAVQSRAEWSVTTDDTLRPEEAAIAAAMARYQEIRRTWQAEGLRELFVDPMIVHGPGATREERLDEFVRRVAAEPHTSPGLTAEFPDCFVAGSKAILRWSYTHPHPTPAQPSPIAGLTLYAFHTGKIVERWQGELPRGTGWS
jgi:SnoaL-like domain